MATLDSIRVKIVAKLSAVADIGQVHDYERFSAKQADMIAQYFDAASGRVKGWYVDRQATREIDIDLGYVRRVHTWKIVGFLTLDDADGSAKLLQDLIEAIATAFRADRTLTGEILDIKDSDVGEGPSGIQVDEVSAVMFAGALCHRAQLRLITTSLEPA